MQNPSLPLQYFSNHFDQYFTQYQDFLRIPSISTESNHQADMQRACDFLVRRLHNLGAEKLKYFQRLFTQFFLLKTGLKAQCDNTSNIWTL